MWEKTDFDFEFQRVNEDIELLKNWLQERRHADLEQGLNRLARAVERLNEKVSERLDQSFPPLPDLDSLFSGETPTVSGMMMFPGDESKGAMPLPPSMLAALLGQLLDQDNEKRPDWENPDPTPRFDWPGPSDN